MQCKDIPEIPILRFLDGLGRWGTTFRGFDNSVQRAMPYGVCDRLAIAKMATMKRRGLVDGCECGCRGDWVLAEGGRRKLLFLDAFYEKGPLEIRDRGGNLVAMSRK